MIDLIATRNIANYGRGSEMTRALHDTCNEIERLTAELEQARNLMRQANDAEQKALDCAEFAEAKNASLVAQLAALTGEVMALAVENNEKELLAELNKIIANLPVEAEKLMRLVEAAGRMIEAGKGGEACSEIRAYYDLEQAYRDLRGEK